MGTLCDEDYSQHFIQAGLIFHPLVVLTARYAGKK